jgi:sugar lactone lactonase YvrE
VTVIPWGNGRARLQEAMGSKDSAALAKGPTCMLAFDDGSFAILDSLGGSVKEFKASGRFSRELQLPADKASKKRPVAVDMAASGPGNYWLLCPEQAAVLHLKAGDRSPRFLPLEGANQDSILVAVSRDDQGVLYVLDANDGALWRLDASGKGLSKLQERDMQGMAIDANGHIYDLQLASRNDARHWNLRRWSRPTGAAAAASKSNEPGFEGLEQTAPALRPETVARITSDRELNRLDVFGVDREGNIYVVLGGGAIEKASKVEVVRFDAQGSVTGRVPCPLDPTELKFTHGKVVSPGGQVFALVVQPKGLEVLKLSGW